MLYEKLHFLVFFYRPFVGPCHVDLSVGLAPYQQTMFEQISSLCSQGESRVLLLGLGGGRMSQYLLDHCSGNRGPRTGPIHQAENIGKDVCV